MRKEKTKGLLCIMVVRYGKTNIRSIASHPFFMYRFSTQHPLWYLNGIIRIQYLCMYKCTITLLHKLKTTIQYKSLKGRKFCILTFTVTTPLHKNCPYVKPSCIKWLCNLAKSLRFNHDDVIIINTS